MSHRPINPSMLRMRLFELFRYDDTSGHLIRIKPVRPQDKIGEVAGSIGKDGYVLLSVDNRNYRSHSLIWLMKTGAWPTNTIDHKDGVRSNNTWGNLRAATRKQNNQNITRARKGSQSGLLGVRLMRGAFQSQLSGTHLGTFSTAEEAHLAYMAARREREELSGF